MGSSCSTLTCCVALEHDDDGMPKKYVLHRTPSAITRRQERSAKRQQKRAAAAAAAAKQLKGKPSPMSKSCSTSSSMMAGLSNDSSIR
ncbi:Hypothetical protein, putative [Bodo saltans]|uniref:Uncharacterized protein n=1 Tax=Bodo saltans TaxID=75058 RepID=A0A0S4J7W5_BODSA|nr:Hypothetical protein, putative [Bodo saltans]|eukprot:CUG87495.1 Hypothetical protein, putative [Bodo saltans]